MAISLTILPGRHVLDTKPGTTILKAAHAGGVDITATCGGRGRCTSCRVKLVAGTAPPPTIMDELQLGDALVREGYRLSCQWPVTEAVTVQIAPPLDDTTFQILGGERPAGAPAPVSIDAGIRKRVAQVTLPKDEHLQTSDLEALLAAAGGSIEDVPPTVLKTLPAALRDRDGEVTVTTFGRRVLAVEAGDTALHKFGLAIDIGTTSVVTTLMELESGEQLAAVSSLNPQAVFGGDLMSRIAFAQFDPGNLRKLQTRIIGLLNQHIEQISRESGVLTKWIYKVVIVGNTCMHHLLLGIDPSYVGLAPYAPVMRHPLTLPARDLFLKLPPEARVCLLPLVAGFVGADAVAVALATRIADSPALRIAVDIGTNGEVLLGSRERLWACSAPAGPALEGAQIRHGMRAAVGAIDRVGVEDGDLRLHTIGDGPAQGLCGSGLVDAVAALLDLGVVDWTGLIDVEGRDRLPAPIRSRVEMRGEERVVVLARPGEHGAEREITLTQDDIRQVQLCKGAIASGVAMLRHVAGVGPERVEELMLAGGFGNYLSVRSALRIGLIPPDLPPERIRYVGNAAALGAQLALVSEAERARAETIAGRIEHVSLAAHPDFETIFVDCMNFPRLPSRPEGERAG
ncbi:MAG TPA: ASKHA domain-containing protein [Candidatus Deferrimicrobiaceae bacterium]|nr:ASKHA domain-containing protein [Candidatus Deferrimicrobiaceae bacterium]